MKKDVTSAGEVLTKELLNQLTDNAWALTGVRGQLAVAKRVHFSFLRPNEKTIIHIPANGLKNWPTEKFIQKFVTTMNSMYYTIIFI